MDRSNGCLEVVQGSHKEEVPLAANKVSCSVQTGLTSVHRAGVGSQAHLGASPHASGQLVGVRFLPRSPIRTELQPQATCGDLRDGEWARAQMGQV
jgi:hypothetical protein